MKYDGVVIKMKKRDNKLYLFLLDPESGELKDGINISDHKCYDHLRISQLMVVNVIFKDGNEELDTIDLEEFIHGDKYGKYDTFLLIHDIASYTIGHDENETSLEKIAKRGDLGKIAKDCIMNSKLINKNE